MIAGGLLCIVITGLVIKRQNDILVKHDKKNGYTAYNNSVTKMAAKELMLSWQNNPAYFKAVKKIVFTDYIWMVFFGSTILYALIIGYSYSSGIWKFIFIAGMICLIGAVAMDVIQDNAIYQYLTKNRFRDFRYLTKLKFTLLILAVLLSLTGIIINWNNVVRSAF
jgi:hypothetical protein